MPSGVYERTPEHRRKISESLKGKRRSPTNEHQRPSPDDIYRQGMHRLADVNPMTRTAVCSRCGPVKIKPICGGKRGHQCMTAVREYQQKYQKEYRRRYQRKYGNHWRNDRRTKSERQAVIDAQNGLCAICHHEGVVVGGRTPLYGDHDHKTGRARGMLCHHCNVMLGMARDNPETLLAAANYLKRYSELDLT